MLYGRINRIIAFLKEKFAEETESSKEMLITYSDYLKGEANDEDLEKANQQLNELLKDLSLGLLACYSFRAYHYPDDRQICKKT